MTWQSEREFRINWQKMQADLQNTTDRIQSAQVIAAAINRPNMGKLSGVAQRIAETKKRLEAQADELAAKLNTLDSKAPEAFARGHATVDQQHADIDAMDAELRQLTNSTE